MTTHSLKIDRNCLLLIVDVQEKVMSVMSSPKKVEKRIVLLIELAKMFHLPVLLTEQQPQVLGYTIKPIKNELTEYKPHERTSFSVLRDETLAENIKAHSGKKIILTGIETHVSILQTCLDLVEAGHEVHIPYDAVDSRNPEDWKMALNYMEKAGAMVTGCETIAFQLLKKSGTPEFKHISKIIRESLLS